jgi:hypothetical protein
MYSWYFVLVLGAPRDLTWHSYALFLGGASPLPVESFDGNNHKSVLIPSTVSFRTAHPFTRLCSDFPRGRSSSLAHPPDGDFRKSTDLVGCYSFICGQLYTVSERRQNGSRRYKGEM